MKRMKTETETTQNNQEKRGTGLNKTFRRFGATVAAAAVLAGGAGVVKGVEKTAHPNPLDRGDNLNLPDYMSRADIDPDTTQLEIADNANIYSSPAKTNQELSNNILAKMNESITARTDKGVAHWDTVDGEFFGLQEKEFKKALANVDPELRQEIEEKLPDNPDSWLWFNDDSVTPIGKEGSDL